jgi:hypothetical protein
MFVELLRDRWAWGDAEVPAHILDHMTVVGREVDRPMSAPAS